MARSGQTLRAGGQDLDVHSVTPLWNAKSAVHRAEYTARQTYVSFWADTRTHITISDRLSQYALHPQQDVDCSASTTVGAQRDDPNISIDRPGRLRRRDSRIAMISSTKQSEIISSLRIPVQLLTMVEPAQSHSDPD